MNPHLNSPEVFCKTFDDLRRHFDKQFEKQV